MNKRWRKNDRCKTVNSSIFSLGFISIGTCTCCHGGCCCCCTSRREEEQGLRPGSASRPAAARGRASLRETRWPAARAAGPTAMLHAAAAAAPNGAAQTHGSGREAWGYAARGTTYPQDMCRATGWPEKLINMAGYGTPRRKTN
jgi:hypothetical protein